MKRMEKSKKHGLVEMVNNNRYSDFYIVLDDDETAKEYYILRNIQGECGQEIFLPIVKPHQHTNE